MIFLLLLTPPTEPPDGEPIAEAAAPNKWLTLAGRIVRGFLLVVIGGAAAVSGAVVSGYLYFARDLPSIEQLKSYSPPIVTQIYANNDELIGEFATQRRIVVPLDQIPRSLMDAFICAEERNFLTRDRLGWSEIIDVFILGRIGAWRSPITGLTTRSFLLTAGRGVPRKFKEAILDFRMERSLGKNYILFLYVNQIYLGSSAYGVEAAARTYFEKSVKDLTISESAMIAGLTKAPTRLSPKKYLGKAIERRNYVLFRMLDDGRITRAQYEEAMKEEPRISTRDSAVNRTAPDFVEHVRRYVEKKYGPDALYKEGLRVYTTVDLDLTAAAVSAMDRGLRELDKREGYRGPLRTLDVEGVKKFLRDNSRRTEGGLSSGQIVEGVVTHIDDENVYVRMGAATENGARKDLVGRIKIDHDPQWWVRIPFIHPDFRTRDFARGDLPFRVGDVILVRVKGTDTQCPDIYAKQFGVTDSQMARQAEGAVQCVHLEPEQAPVVQSALMMRENRTGYVRVMLGGSDGSTYNRAVQARRNAGSSFRPVIYAAALEKGFVATDTIEDFALETSGSPCAGAGWRVDDGAGPSQGSVTLRTALVKSLDGPTIKLLQRIGVGYAQSYARRLGYTSPLADDLTLVLGCSRVSLEEQLNAFSVYPNHGYYVPPIFVKKVIDRHGRVLEEHVPPILSNDSSLAASENGAKHGSPTAARRAMSEAAASAIASILQSVVQAGTASVLKETVGRPDISGMTGTNKDCTDAWFMGFSPDYTCGVWVGFDEAISIGQGETGAQAAAPIWGYFMRELLKETPVKELLPPKSTEYSPGASPSPPK